MVIFSKTAQKIAFFVGCGLLSTSLLADTIEVLVRCSNGRAVPRLSVSVRDADGVAVPGNLKTDQSGKFLIENSETFNAPFYMSFTTKTGATCGYYPIYELSPTQGYVGLNYYPTNLPCSCAQLFN